MRVADSGQRVLDLLFTHGVGLFGLVYDWRDLVG